MIQPGQIFRAVRPTPSDPERRHIRIKVVSTPCPIPGVWGFGKVDVVTLTAAGREVRRRRIETSQLHATDTTRDGKPRRNGYVLEASTDNAPTGDQP